MVLQGTEVVFKGHVLDKDILQDNETVVQEK